LAFSLQLVDSVSLRLVSISRVSPLDSLFCRFGFAEGHVMSWCWVVAYDCPVFVSQMIHVFVACSNMSRERSIEGLLSLTEDACFGLSAVSLSVGLMMQILA
jgi:hypothetical protein